MAASTSGVDDGNKKIRIMSLTYLKNSFHKKSASSPGCAETGSNNDVENCILEKIGNRGTTSANCNNEDKSCENVVESNDTSNSKEKSNGFFRDIKKRLHIKDLKLCKSKQKIKAIEPSSPAYGLNNTLDVPQNQLPIIFFNEKKNCDLNITNICATNGETGYSNIARNNSQRGSIDEQRDQDEEGEEEEKENRLNDEPENVSSGIGNVAEPQASSSRESGEVSPYSESKSEKKFNLTEELLKLSKYGWYWGPISRDEADTKLSNEPDGAFLVRDSFADKYLLTLSFKSSGKLLHTRVEHSGGLFSLYHHPECERFSSVVALINHSMSFSQSAVYCYSRPRYPGHPAFPVRLTKPVSRFTQVRSLQYLCRFIIRQNTRVDNIGKLPLPETIKGYIEEAHY